MKYSLYQTAKDSGFDWLGGIPAHWQLKQLRHSLIGGLCNGVFKKKEDFGVGTKLVNVTDLFTTDSKIDFDTLGRVRVDEPEQKTFGVQQGDVFFVRSSLKREGIATSALITEVPEPTVFECHIVRGRPNQSYVFPKFLINYLNSTFIRQRLISLAETTTMTTIGQDKLASLPLTLPSIEEQLEIVSFLDQETGKLDALIEKQERLIELLHEKRQALISHAVTKGLNPDAPMKDSGIGWMGNIPADWQCGRLKFFVSVITSGSRYWAQHYSESGALFVRIGNLSRTSISLDLNDVQFVSPPSGAEVERTRIKRGDVLISVTAYIGSVGVVTDEIGEAYMNQHIALCRACEELIDPRWLGYCLFSSFGQTQFRRLLYGGTKDGLGLDDVANLLVIVPPLKEQQAIISYLDSKNVSLDALGEKAKQAIQLLKEHRAALISAAVTGKIDVRRNPKSQCSEP